MDENIIETTEEAVAESPKKKKPVKTLITVFSTVTAAIIVAAILLSTVFAPYGHYLSARWYMLCKDFQRAYIHLEKIDKPILDTEEILAGFIVKPGTATYTGDDGNAFYKQELAYDENGNIISEKTSDLTGAFKETYDYDDRGNLIEKTFYVKGDIKSYSIIREYDEHNNVTSYEVVYGDDLSTLKITLDYTYEGKYPSSADMVIVNGQDGEEYSAELTFSHDKKGYLTEIVYKGEHTVLDYTKGRVDCETVFSFVYDDDYFLSEYTITESFSYVNEYTDKEHTQKYERRKEYDKTKPLKLEWKKTFDSKVTTGWKEWEYDKNGNLTYEKSYDPYDGTSFIEYTYDKKGFLIYKNDNDDHIEEYTNDKYGNPTVTKHTRGEEKEVDFENCEYEYDKYGNILNKTIKAEATSSLSAYTTTIVYEDWQVVYKPINKRNVFELYDLYSYITFLKF